MALGQAHESYIGLGRESTLGTTVTRTKFFDIVSENLKVESKRDVAPILGTPSQRVFKETGLKTAGVIEVIANLEGHEPLYKDAFGTNNTTGTNPYTHVMTLAKTLPSPGLSIEVNRDLKAYLYADCKVNQVEWSQDPNGYMRVRFSILGRARTSITATSPSFPSDKPITADLAVFNIGGSPVSLHNFRLTLDNSIAHRGMIGSKQSREPVRTGVRMVTGSYEIDFEDETELNAFINSTSRAIDITWTSSADSYKLECPLIKYLGDEPTTSGPGPYRIPFKFVALEQTRAAMDELKLTIINTVSTVI